MKIIEIIPIKSFDKIVENIATDKSISHRCAMFSIFSDKPSYITNFLQAEDTLNSLKIIESLGSTIKVNGNLTTITPPKIKKEPERILDCGNSGTGMRLFCGLLAGMEGFYILVGDKYLQSRPMNRVVSPLRSIGSIIDGRENGNLAPLSIRGGSLNGFEYISPVASAQVKSALILAALNAKTVSTYTGIELTRDHSENMLKGMGAELETKIGDNGEEIIKITPLKKPLEPLNMEVPSDPSSAFFFAVLTAITPDSKIVLKNVLLNKTRIEAFNVLSKMGTKIEFIETSSKYEKIGDIIVTYSPLYAVEVSENISWLIDELPALSIAMSCATGTSVIKNAKELRVKESDRIKSVVDNLNLCGIKTKEYEDGYEVVGGTLKSATINSYGDHRIAMSFIVAGAKCGMSVEDIECIETSFPNFMEIFDTISK